jgi:recombination protein RecT
MTDDDGTVAGAVAHRRDQRTVTQRTKAATDWYAILAPSHANPQALVQLSLAQLDKIKDLRTAATANPNAWLSAVAETARLGLMPGDTIYYLPFKSKEDPTGWTISTVVHWTGEVELIYRTGLVETVVCEVVREHDQFAWDPSAMRVPEHHIAPNATGQVGLADQDDRGKLTGVYCYVIFKGGGTSHPTVMTAREVGRHRAASRAGDAFWGPAHPAEGAWTVDMWRKTAIHKHSGSVPTSPEYLAQVTQNVARALETAPPGIELGGSDQPLPIDASPPMALDAGNGGDRPAPGTIAGKAEGRRDANPLNKGEALNELGVTWRALGLADADGWRRVTTGLLGLLAVEDGADPIQVGRPSDLTAGQARQAVSNLGGIMAAVGGDTASAQAALLRLAHDQRIWDGQDPPAPAGFVIEAAGS